MAGFGLYASFLALHTTYSIKRMKKRYYPSLLSWALLVAMPLWFSRCTKESHRPAVVPGSIEGSWKIASMTVNPAVETNYFGKIDDFYQLLVNLGAESCLQELTFTFDSNGTASALNPISCQEGDDSIDGKERIDEINEITPIADEAQWSMKGNKLTIIESDGSVETYDTVVHGNTVTLSSQKDIEDVNGDMVQTTMTMVLTRT